MESNRHRTKTNEQLGREAAELLAVERERERQRQKELAASRPNTQPDLRLKSSEGSGVTGKATEKLAEQLGIGPQKVERAVKVVEAIDTLAAEGKEEEALGRVGCAPR